MVRNRTWMLMGMVVVAGGVVRGTPLELDYRGRPGWCPGIVGVPDTIANEHPLWHMSGLMGVEFVEYHREFLAQFDDYLLFDIFAPAGAPENAIIPVVAQPGSQLTRPLNLPNQFPAHTSLNGFSRPAGCDITVGCGGGLAQVWTARPPVLRLRNLTFHTDSANDVGMDLDSIIHGQGHMSISNHDGGGGDMGSLSNATRDGAFYEWHKNIDNIYADWAVGKFQLVDNTGTPIFFSVDSAATGAAGSSLNRRRIGGNVYWQTPGPGGGQFGAIPRIASDIYVGDDTDVDPTAVVTRNLLFEAGVRKWSSPPDFSKFWDVDAWTILNPPGNGWYFSVAPGGADPQGNVYESAGAGAKAVYRTAAQLGLAAGDNLDALEVDQQKRVQATNDYARPGIADRPKQWFSLRSGSENGVKAIPCAGGAAVAAGPSDILQFDANGSLCIAVTAATLGLGAVDMDALVITDEDASNTLSAGDRIYYSVAAPAATPGDIFCRVYPGGGACPAGLVTATAANLAIAGEDLDALDVRQAGTNVGACCHSDGTCTEVLAAACNAAGDNFWGPGTVCSAAECPSAPGGCCHRDGTCTLLSDIACLGAGGRFRGVGSICNQICWSCSNDGLTCITSADCSPGCVCLLCPQAPTNNDCYGAYPIPYDYPSQYQPGYDYYEPPPQYTDNTYADTTDEYYPPPPQGYTPPPPPAPQYYDPPYSCRDMDTFFPPYGSGTIWYYYDVPSQPAAGPGTYRPIGLYTSKTHDSYTEDPGGGYAGDTTIAVYYAPHYNNPTDPYYPSDPYGCYGLQEVACGDNHYEQYSPENQGYGKYGYAEYYPQQPGRYYIQLSTVGNSNRGRIKLRVSSPQQTNGACCVPDTGPPNNGCVLNVTEDACIKYPGRFMGVGTTSCPPHDAQGNCIPTVSEWGLLVMAVLVLTAATVVILRRRAAATA